MFLLPKILKPDVPPKRHIFRLNTLHGRFLSRFLPTRYLSSIGNPVAQKGPSAQGKVLRRDGAQNHKDNV